MKFPWFRKNDVLDLTKEPQRQESSQKEVQTPSQNVDEEVIDLSFVEEKKKKLAKRLSGIIEKLDELSNKIYHLEQRTEVLEKKSGINNYQESDR